jgi:hypothetical protein
MPFAFTRIIKILSLSVELVTETGASSGNCPRRQEIYRRRDVSGPTGCATERKGALLLAESPRNVPSDQGTNCCGTN